MNTCPICGTPALDEGAAACSLCGRDFSLVLDGCADEAREQLAKEREAWRCHEKAKPTPAVRAATPDPMLPEPPAPPFAGAVLLGRALPRFAAYDVIASRLPLTAQWAEEVPAGALDPAEPLFVELGIAERRAFEAARPPCWLFGRWLKWGSGRWLTGLTLLAPGSPASLLPVHGGRLPGMQFADTLADGSRGPRLVVLPPGLTRTSEGVVGIARPMAIGCFPVTCEEMERFRLATGRSSRNRYAGRRPVTGVSCADADDYLGWLSGQTGRSYRLPTDGEWEYAARAGRTGPWLGEERGTLPAHVWYSENGPTDPSPVGLKEPNPWGLHDMLGNVWEWVTDGASHLARGGACTSVLEDLTEARRRFRPIAAEARLPDCGFRVVAEIHGAP